MDFFYWGDLEEETPKILHRSYLFVSMLYLTHLQ